MCGYSYNTLYGVCTEFRFLCMFMFAGSTQGRPLQAWILVSHRILNETCRGGPSFPPEEFEHAENEMFIACLPNEPKENYGKLLAIPSEDMTGKYARYLLASACNDSIMWNVYVSGYVYNYDNNLEFGVRPRSCTYKNKICKRQKNAGRTQGPPLQA